MVTEGAEISLAETNLTLRRKPKEIAASPTPPEKVDDEYHNNETVLQ